MVKRCGSVPAWCRPPSVFEINTYEQLKELDEESRNLKSELLETVAGVLGCGQEEILDIGC